jgi:hypothetical protein
MRAISMVCALLATTVHATTPAEQLAAYSAQASTVASPALGKQFFTATHGKEWSCSTCHGALPVQAGKHASTGKPIGPMAPAFNVERFSDTAKTEKWFRRNCNDVAGRECTASEKADVLAWLVSLKS